MEILTIATGVEAGIAQVPVHRVQGEQIAARADRLAVEEPLEIRLAYEEGGTYRRQNVAVTMRTPGHDAELAVGFLHGEGILRRRADLEAVDHCGEGECQRQRQNVLRVRLRAGVAFDAARLDRNFYTTSSCGVCGKTSLEALEVVGCPTLPAGRPVIDATRVHRLPETLRQAQAVFEQTGGLHAAALFDPEGRLLGLREDVGRHNAVDKLVGACLLEDLLPLHDRILLVSGRASFELAQKALMAGIPILAAVGAPSSLAVDLAQRFGMTLLGFVRNDRFNVYTGAERLRTHTASTTETTYHEATHQG